MNQSQFEDKVSQICSQIKNLLLTKNRNYGSSALEPLRIFSSADKLEQIKVRIDDKLSRIKNIKDKQINDEDTVLDLIGYLIIYKIVKEEVKS